ncbi:MAG TPA: serine/threonine-protein kinase [Kofleriaceae bacterium]|nr:serine/threonine-protein kinase [Kofleriaceae bacterium]
MDGAAGPRKLSEGTMLDDKYRIERLLATGGMGAVYLGTHIKLRKRVAIKVLNPHLNSTQMVERFHREAITASQIGHEGIAQVTDIGTSSEGEPFLVMEYLEGESLARRLQTAGPLAIEDACELGCAILSPLAAAHHAGIVHRDLKPDNVFLVRQSRGEMVKLLDFGISRASGLEAEFRLTTTGLVLGTPYYMSPEQARGDSEVTPAADLYAFGVMLYEMLIGDVPIRAENYNQLMYRVMIGDFVRPRERRPELPEALERIILQAMAQEPEQRQASAVELEQALLAFCRPAFRDRASGSLSSPALAMATPPPLAGHGTPGGLPRGQLGADHTLIAGSSASAPAMPADAQSPSLVATPRERPVAPVAPVAPRRSRRPWIVAAILVAGGVAGVLVLGRHGDPVRAAGAPVVVPPGPPVPPRPPERPVAAAVVDAATAPAPEAQPAGAAEPGPATVTVRFSVDPASAAIAVDGVRIKDTELVVPRDSAPHVLRITAPGHVAHDETIRFDENQRVVVQLRRAGGPARPADRHKPRPDERIDSESPY